MITTLFNGIVNVYLFGDSALQFLGYLQNVPTFRINGFVDPEINITDYRVGIGQAVEEYFSTHSPLDFFTLFNRPALLTIQEADEGKIEVILNDTNEEIVTDYLWIAVGIGNEVPAYKYLLWKAEPMTNDRYALFSIFTTISSPEHYFEVSSPEVDLDVHK